LLQNSDIPKHTWKVVEGGGSQSFYGERYELLFLKGDRFENILDSNEDWHQ
jgi:hypothetical protein